MCPTAFVDNWTYFQHATTWCYPAYLQLEWFALFRFITTGVPQGSVLGPLLFIIYTNDLPLNIENAKCILFADDTTIYESSRDMPKLYTCTSLNNNLNILADWFRANKLSLNVNKTVYMIFDHSLRPVYNVQHLKIGTDLIERVRSTKFLGLHIDDKLKWSEHIRHVKGKLSSSLYALRSARNVLSSDQLKTVYNSMFNPTLIMVFHCGVQLHRLH